MKNIVCGGNTRINTESMAVSSRLVKQCLHFPTFKDTIVTEATTA